MTRLLPLLLCVALTALPAVRQAAAQGSPTDSGRSPYTPTSSLTEAALASCAGGATIGALVVLASGVGSPSGTAVLFCGLSAAATVTSALTSATWRAMTGVFH